MRTYSATWPLVIGLKNSGIIWWFSSWISTSLKSSTRLLIWLRQMPPHSRNRNWLFTAGWLLLRRILYAHQHHRLTWNVFFLSVCGILCSGRRSIANSSYLKCARVWNWIKVFVCYWVCFVRTEQCVCVWQQHSNNLALCCLKTMADSYFWFMWQYNATGKKSLCSWTNNTWHSVIQKFSTIKKRYNIKTKIITRELYKN